MKAKPKKYPKKNRCSLDVRPIPVTVIHSRPSRPRKPKKIPRKNQKNTQKKPGPELKHRDKNSIPVSASLEDAFRITRFLGPHAGGSFIMLNGVPYLLACFCKKHATRGPSSIGISASDGEGCSSLFLELHLPSLAKPWRNTRILMVLRWLRNAGSGQRRVYRKCPGGCSMADHGYSEATAVCCQL